MTDEKTLLSWVASLSPGECVALREIVNKRLLKCQPLGIGLTVDKLLVSPCAHRILRQNELLTTKDLVAFGLAKIHLLPHAGPDVTAEILMAAMHLQDNLSPEESRQFFMRPGDIIQSLPTVYSQTGPPLPPPAAVLEFHN